MNDTELFEILNRITKCPACDTKYNKILISGRGARFIYMKKVLNKKSFDRISGLIMNSTIHCNNTSCRCTIDITINARNERLLTFKLDGYSDEYRNSVYFLFSNYINKSVGENIVYDDLLVSTEFIKKLIDNKCLE